MVGWQEILKSEVAKTSITKVAAKIGYARSSVSLAMNDKYVGSTDRLATAVLDAFSNHVQCPHLKRSITVENCRDYHTRAIPQSNAAQLRHWRGCQICPRNTYQEKECADA